MMRTKDGGSVPKPLRQGQTYLVKLQWPVRKVYHGPFTNAINRSCQPAQSAMCQNDLRNIKETRLPRRHTSRLHPRFRAH